MTDRPNSLHSQRLGRGMRLGGLLLLWLVMVGLMIQDWLTDPYDPSRVGTAAYGHNHDGALRQVVLISLVELAVLYAILRPWSYRHSTGRALVALLLCIPWTLLSGILTMHAGGVVELHLVWLLSVLVLLLVLISERGSRPAAVRRSDQK